MQYRLLCSCKETNRLLRWCTTNSCCCSTPSLLLKPGNTFGPGSTRAGRGAGPPYCSRYDHRRGNCCIIHRSSVEAIWIHAQRRLCPCDSHRCPQLIVVCTHFGFLLKKSPTKYKYRHGVILHQVHILRVRTTNRENIAICDGDIRLDRHIIWL